MKKTYLVMLILFTLILSACSGATPTAANVTSPAYAAPAEQSSATTAPAATIAADQASTGSSELNTTYENAVSIENQLILGTFKLIGTGQAVTKDQAATLLPLWTQYQQLVQSAMPGQGDPSQAQGSATPQPQPTSAETQAQKDALIKQIMAAMTSDQIKAIADLKITQETSLTIMEEIGLGMGKGGPQQGSGDSSAQGQPPAGGPQQGGDGSGQAPQGTPPAGGPQPGGDNAGGAQGTPPAGGGQQQGGTPPAGGQMTPPQGGGMFSQMLVKALVSVLEKVSAGETVTLPLELTNISGAPSGAPAGGPAGGGPGGAPSGNSSSGLSSVSAVYSLSGGTETKSNQAYDAANTDQSAVYVTDGGNLTLSDATITSSGNTSSADSSSFYGLNAAVLAANGSTLNFSNSTVTSSGSGANGIFSNGSGTTVNVSKVTIKATGDGGHGVMATQGGVMTLTDVNMDTAGKNSGAIATDRGSGTITATGGTVTTSGQDSPAIYSTGAITVTGGTLSASGAEAAVIEGANSITLNDSSLSSSLEKWGVMIYQSMSGDAEGTKGVFTMTGGSLAYTPAKGPLFYVTNSTGVITLKGVNINLGSGTLLKAGMDKWGNNGSNGGQAVFTADGQTLTGNLAADKASTLALTLQNTSSLSGAINTEHTAKSVSLSLDATSTWNVTADSYLTSLSDASGISGTSITNITGNGHTVYYDTASCPDLGGKTYALAGGGNLQPAS